MSEQYIRIEGGAWISGSHHGFLHKQEAVQLSNDPIALSEIERMCNPLPNRYGRFSDFTKLGFLGIALCLNDAGGLAQNRSCGVVFSTKFETLAADSEFYRTTMEEDGIYSSANLFPYTLPVLAAGEAASHFQLNGPTFTVDDQVVAGERALECAILQMADDPGLSMLTGWLDLTVPFEPQRPGGTMFALMSPSAADGNSYLLDVNSGCLVHPESRKVMRSVADLFA